jgi:biopolymer transport protein ExbD
MRRGHSYFEVERPRIEIIPMIDIMMFLLVFFIVITLRMISGAGIQLDLPGSATTQDLPPSKVTVGVKRDGALFVDGRQLSAEELQGILERDKKAGQVEVVIAGEKEVSLQTLLHVMDIARRAGITAVGIAAKSEGGT